MSKRDFLVEFCSRVCEQFGGKCDELCPLADQCSDGHNAFYELSKEVMEDLSNE